MYLCQLFGISDEFLGKVFRFALQNDHLRKIKKRSKANAGFDVRAQSP